MSNTTKSKREPDIYDREIARLKRAWHNARDDGQRQDIMAVAWCFGDRHSPLFDTCSPSGDGTGICGCLTQVRSGSSTAFGKKFTERVRQDERLPDCLRNITPSTLQVFAEYQREIDAMPRSIKCGKRAGVKDVLARRRERRKALRQTKARVKRKA